jgi:hypothetical protein
MKAKIVLLSGIFCGFMYFSACQDGIDQVGMGIQPDEDKIVVFEDSIPVTGETVKIDSIYAKSVNGLLGRFYDPYYGELKAGYICQFYPSVGFGDQNNMDSILSVDSVQLKILYTTYFGDSLSAMEVTVYPAVKPLTGDYYSNTDPAQFSDMQTILGKRAYTARDLNISDSLNLANLTTNYKQVSVPLSKEVGERFLAEYEKANHGAYASPAAMAQFFPGVYVASTFGSGSILNVDKTYLYIFYSRLAKGSSNQDTTVVKASVLDVTKEVIQLNHYTGSNEEKLTDPNEKDKMYLKTPAGIFSQITIPVSEIKKTVGKRKFSNVKLNIEAYPKEDWKYAMNFPGMSTATSASLVKSQLLLIAADSADVFLKGHNRADGKTSFATQFNAQTYSYTFDNISNLVQNAMDKGTDELVLRLVPVQVAYNNVTDPYYGTSYQDDYDTSNYLAPSAVTLKKSGLQIQIIAADLKR